jgi:formate dehydrogenase
MADASICGLGQAAPNPIRLTMQHFGPEVGLPEKPAGYDTQQSLERSKT